MTSYVPLSLLLLASIPAYAAEDAGGPPPAPPVPAPAAPAAEATPPVSTPASPASVPASTEPQASPRAYRVATVAEQPPVLQLTLVVDAGYDSNVLLLPDASSGTGQTRSGSGTGGTEGRLDWRAWQGQQGFVRLGASARQDDYLDAPIDTSSHYGGNVVASYMNAERTLIPALVLSGNRYQLDGDTVADDGFGRLSLAWRGSDRVDILALDIHRILYAQDALDERSGILWAGNLRHWFLLADDQPGRRLELGVRAGRYLAHEDWQTYLMVRPDLSFSWRCGEGGDAGQWRLTLGSGVEWRRYAAEVPGLDGRERQLVWDTLASASYGLNATSHVGPFAGFTRRLDNIADYTYDRWQAGIRLLVTLP